MRQCFNNLGLQKMGEVSKKYEYASVLKVGVTSSVFPGTKSLFCSFSPIKFRQIRCLSLHHHGKYRIRYYVKK
jgi:hypothetical protein